jgi:hypothetical protein
LPSNAAQNAKSRRGMPNVDADDTVLDAHKRHHRVRLLRLDENGHAPRSRSDREPSRI